MKRTSISELHLHTSELVREAAEGQVIVIERRGEPVAELRPYTNPKPRHIDEATKARIWAEMHEIWAKMPVLEDCTPLISEDRDR